MNLLSKLTAQIGLNCLMAELVFLVSIKENNKLLQNEYLFIPVFVEISNYVSRVGGFLKPGPFSHMPSGLTIKLLPL